MFIKMDNLKKILEVLNDLIRINKDREAGYSKMSRDLTPAEHNLRSAFERKAQESRNNISQLEHVAEELNDQLPADDSEGINGHEKERVGRIYRMWSEVKDFFTGKDRSSALKSCADGEEKAKVCYENALTEVELPRDIYSLIDAQKTSLDASQQEIIQLAKSTNQDSGQLS
jgi:uncharacterized protein (TIGR02284 family)